MQSELTIALAGNPNSGKTTAFNSLTGSHQHVGNYPGITVEKKEGYIRLLSGESVRVIDLPGTYFLCDHERALGDPAVPEAGFGADLGAEKFLDIKCRFAGLNPSACVVVATVRALKMHGGVAKADLARENLSALEAGLPNLLRHVRNMREVYGLPTVVALNRFPTDTDAEIALVMKECEKLGVQTVLSTVWADGGRGGEELARAVVGLCDQKSEFRFCYDEKLPIKSKIAAIVKKIYGGDGVEYTPEAEAEISRLEGLGFGRTPVCMAKTQYSFSDDAKKLGAPEHFTVTVRGVKISAGAGFVVAFTGNILTMPGLPPVPAAEKIDVDENGVITGLF